MRNFGLNLLAKLPINLAFVRCNIAVVHVQHKSLHIVHVQHFLQLSESKPGSFGGLAKVRPSRALQLY